jgi:triose/dihydroxyacetone kinase / FAD-AMP lyase (cyclizing)
MCRCTGKSCKTVQVAGDVAATGAPLAAVKHAAVQALKHLATMGAALTSCSLPGQPPKEKLPLGVMELGLGIHGERGAEQCPNQSADELVSTLLQRILLSSKLTPVISSTKHIALLINNLGTSTGMEMKIVVRAALKQLRGAHLAPASCACVHQR